MVRVEGTDPPLDSVTWVEVRVAVAPDGETFVCRLMVPLNPLRLVNVIVEEFENPDCTISEGWLE